jgi:O-antigen biosynthesis protein
VRVFDEAPHCDRRRHLERLQTLMRRPRFSILAMSQSPNPSVFDRLANSLVEQIYPEWQLILAVPSAMVDVVRARLSPHANGCVEVLAQASGSGATRNLLAAKAIGEFLIPISPDAIVRPNALLELALTLEAYPDAALIYSDEDRIGSDGKRRDPSFKPAWSPDIFDVSDYVGSLTVLRRELVAAVGGWRQGRGLACDYDLKLRIIDRIEPDKIIHLAKILVHTMPDLVTAETSVRTSIARVVSEHCARQHLLADVLWTDDAATPRLKYRVPEPPPLVSLLIPTRDRAAILEKCIRSILALTRYRPYEIIIVDNDSREPATKRLFQSLHTENMVHVLPHPGPFNFSALNNAAAQAAKGSIFGFVNNDVEITDGDWLGEMVSLAVRPEVGCVGSKLLYPDRRIQHAGIQLGPGNLAGHGHRFAGGDAPGYMNRLRMLQNVSVVTAACLVVRRSVFDEIGGLDEELRVAFNDVDLCLKIAAAGYRNLWTPFAKLIHHESVSRGRDDTPAKAQRLLHEVTALRRRWGPALLSDPYYSPHLTYDREDFSIRTR